MRENWLIGDLHIHSKYSRACSKDLNIENLVKWARIKGVDLLGTGDFTHPKWLEEIKSKLKEENGIYWYEDSRSRFPFILSSEISLIYTKNGKGRRVHLVYLAPSVGVVEKINAWLDSKGRRDYDGRPIFGISCRDFAAKMEEIDERIEVIPAHCLLPDSFIHLDREIKKIKDIKEGDLVFTHNNQFKRVKEVLTRDYKGKIYRIRPWYFSDGLKTTPEHPFYVIKSYKNCKSTKGLCKPLCSVNKTCKKKYYLNYKLEWIIAEKIEKGDFLVYPRFNGEEDFDSLDITKFVKNYKLFNRDFVLPKNSRNNRNYVNRTIKVNSDFCKLLGYFLSEGYVSGKGAIGFSFHKKEKEYIEEVIKIIYDIFGVSEYKIDSRRENQADIIFFSGILNEFFSNFYCENVKRAWSKSLPNEFLYLKKDKIAEILRCWWRGDLGYSVSRQLINQMKLICIKLGIIPSILIHKSEDYNRRGKHFVDGREIISERDLYQISNLSFFEEDYCMLNEKCFKRNINKINRKHGWIDKNYIYLPVRKIEIEDYSGEVYNLEVEGDNSYVSEFACVHNCWTPHFGVFGSGSGFDSLKEAFEDKTHLIHAIETGISADPEMCWKIKDLDDKSIISFSDLHSFWPWRLGREATIFLKKDKLTYDEIIRQIREKDFFGTIEADPCYGKYHLDGHRNCNFSCSGEETKRLNGICPVCGKSLTIGVEYRVFELEKKGVAEHKNKKFYYKLLPLHEILSLGIGIGVNSKGCWKIYNELIEKFHDEYNILLFVSKEELAKVLNNELLLELIMLNRDGKIQVKPGYDGVYGKAIIDGKEVGLEDEEKIGSDLNKSEKSKKVSSLLANNEEFAAEVVNMVKKSRELQKKLF